MPPELSAYLGDEPRDFAVKAGRDQPLNRPLSQLLFGAAWTALTSVFVIVFLVPVWLGKEVHFEVNGVPTVAGPNNLEPLLWPGIFIGVFVLIGVGMMAWGLGSLLREGGYFVGTPTRLIHYFQGDLRSIDWEQFSGDMAVRGNGRKGTLSLQLRTGRMVSNKRGTERYVPDVIHLVDITQVFEIEAICRSRIKENDPTPATDPSRA